MVGDAQPLDDVRLLKLTRNTEILVKMIDVDSSLLTHMLAARCITVTQKQIIESGSTPSQRNTTLLDFMRRTSISNYDKFIECLRASHQQHIASLLTEDTGEHCV